MPTTTWDFATRLAATMTLKSIQEGSITEMRLKNQALKALDFTPEEIAKFGIDASQPGQVTWKTEANGQIFDVTLEEGWKNLMAAKLEQFSTLKRFPQMLMPLADFLEVEQLATAK